MNKAAIAVIFALGAAGCLETSEEPPVDSGSEICSDGSFFDASISECVSNSVDDDAGGEISSARVVAICAGIDGLPPEEEETEIHDQVQVVVQSLSGTVTRINETPPASYNLAGCDLFGDSKLPSFTFSILASDGNSYNLGYRLTDGDADLTAPLILAVGQAVSIVLKYDNFRSGATSLSISSDGAIVMVGETLIGGLLGASEAQGIELLRGREYGPVDETECGPRRATQEDFTVAGQSVSLGITQSASLVAENGEKLSITNALSWTADDAKWLCTDLLKPMSWLAVRVAD